MSDPISESAKATQKIAKASPPPRSVLQIEVDPSVLKLPAQHAIVISSEVIDFVFAAMEGSDLSQKPVNKDARYRFNSPPLTAAQRRDFFEAWLYARSFQEVVRGLRESLEHAFFFVELATGRRKVPSDSTFQALLDSIRKRAKTMHFDQLIRELGAKLSQPLNFEDAYKSLNLARNCFEHRGGIVGDTDAPSGGVMILKFPRVKLFYVRDNEEIELQPGHVVEPEGDCHEVQVMTKLELRELRFGLGKRLSLSLRDFNEIAFACNFFVEDLTSKVIAAITTRDHIAPVANPSPIVENGQ